jgi:hydrogenase nickel incorporation protein HypA/HybF
MHELSVIQSIVDAIVEKLGDTEVARVRLVIGRQAGVVVDAIRFSFDLVTEGTTLAGAALDIDEPPGRELRIVSVEVWKECAPPAAAATTPESA